MSLVIRTVTLICVVSSGIVSLAGYSHPDQVTPIEQHPVRAAMPPEIPSATPKTDRAELFDSRFAQIRVVPIDRPEPPPLPTVRPEGQEPVGEPEPKTNHRHVMERERRDDRPTNVCERHHLRKVVTNGGRSWRCRR